MGWSAKAALFALAFLGIGSLVYYLYERDEREADEDYMTFTTAKSRTLEIKVPKESVGLIVGRGGSKLKEMESLTDTSIHFMESKEPDVYKICVVRGREESVHIVEQLIHEAIVNQPLIECFQMYVPYRACGRIIGKNGESIRSISLVSNAKISLENCFGDSEKSDRRVTIRGTAEQIEHAKLLIEQKVEEDNTFRNMIQTGTANRSPRHKANYMLKGPEELEAKEVVTDKEALIATGSDGLLEVYVSAVSDPDKFWVQMIGPSTVSLDRLNEQMTDYYCKEENRQLHVLKDVSLQQIVAAPFWNDSKWYRAEVSEIKVNEYDEAESQLTLYYLDYGDSAVCKKKDVYELRTDFLRLRFQAIECSLAKVKPRGYWTEEATDLFEMLTHTGLWKALTAKVHGYKERPTRAKREGSPVPCVELYDSEGANVMNVSDELVKKGFAVWDVEDKDGKVKRQKAEILKGYGAWEEEEREEEKREQKRGQKEKGQGKRKKHEESSAELSSGHEEKLESNVLPVREV